jgi:hypothetical protein
VDLDVGDPALAVAALQVLDLSAVGVEDVVVGEHRVAVDGAGDVGGRRDPERPRHGPPAAVCRSVDIPRMVAYLCVRSTHFRAGDGGRPARMAHLRILGRETVLTAFTCDPSSCATPLVQLGRPEPEVSGR